MKKENKKTWIHKNPNKILTYKEFKKSPRLLYYRTKLIYEYNDKRYYLFSKTTDLKKNEENLKNCYDYMKEYKQELLRK